MPFCSKPGSTAVSVALILLAGSALTTKAIAANQSYPVAGVNPDARPAGAPVITAVTKQKGWYQQALTGVNTPYPSSLHFLENQGNWYTPFNRPGMTGPYDIRNWHQ